MNSLAETPGKDTHNPKKLTKSKRFTGKRALQISDTPALEALARISSAVEKSKKGILHSDKEIKDSAKGNAYSEKQPNHDLLKHHLKYYEVPGLLDGFRMVFYFLFALCSNSIVK